MRPAKPTYRPRSAPRGLAPLQIVPGFRMSPSFPGMVDEHGCAIEVGSSLRLPVHETCLLMANPTPGAATIDRRAIMPVARVESSRQGEPGIGHARPLSRHARLRRRNIAKPQARPASVIANVEGSGTAGALNWTF